MDTPKLPLAVVPFGYQLSILSYFGLFLSIFTERFIALRHTEYGYSLAIYCLQPEDGHAILLNGSTHFSTSLATGELAFFPDGLTCLRLSAASGPEACGTLTNDNTG